MPANTCLYVNLSVCTCVHILYCMCVHTHTHRFIKSQNARVELFLGPCCFPFHSRNLSWQVAIHFFVRNSLWYEGVQGSRTPVMAGQHFLLQAEICLQKLCPQLPVCSLQQGPGKPLSFLFTPWRDIDTSAPSTFCLRRHLHPSGQGLGTVPRVVFSLADAQF